MRPDIFKSKAADHNHRDEIDRLLSLERGNRLDIGVRLVGVPAGSVLLYLYTSDPIAFAWSGGYVACYLLYRVYLNSLGAHVSLVQQMTAHVIIVVLTISFLWMPSWMLVNTDRNQVLVGAALVGSQLMHLVHRGDTPLFLILGVTAAVFGIMATLLAYVLPQITEPVAIVGILITWFLLVFYLGQSLLAARARILAENAAKRQVFQAQKLAALGQLAGGIAHDFNNILTAISGNLELYEVLTDPSEKDEVINAAQMSSQRAAKIVRQILIYARKSPVTFEVVDANAPLASIDVLTEHLVPSSIQLDVIPLPVAQSVRIDTDQLVTALMNLVLNAVDAIPAGGQITLSVVGADTHSATRVVGDRTLKPGPYVVYDVTDTGEGIPDDIIKHVVDPFFTTKPVGKGTGLGLSMAVSIAESVGGGLQIETSSAGTSVRIFVPLAA